MATKLNSRTPIEDLHEIVTDFDRRNPNIFDDEANEYIASLGKFKLRIFINFFFLVWTSLLLLGMSMENANNIAGIIFFLLALAFGFYMFWRIFFIFSKNSSGKRALERCARAAGIADADLHEFRRAHVLIRSMLDRKNQKSRSGSGGFFGNGCGSSGGGGGGGGGCGGGGGGGGG